MPPAGTSRLTALTARWRDWSHRYAVTLLALNGFIGVLRVVESPNRTQSDAYRAAKEVMPIRAWGLMFLAGFVAVLLSRAHEWMLRVAAVIGSGVWAFWALTLVVTAYTDGRSSYAGGVLYGAGAIRHLQVARRH